jgi:hypothetical protein
MLRTPGLAGFSGVPARWTAMLLAPAITYVPTAGDPESEMLQRSVHPLRKAGVG